MDRLIRAVASEVVILASVSLDEGNLRLVLVTVGVGKMYLQMGYFLPSRACIYVDAPIVFGLRVLLVVYGDKITWTEWAIVGE